MLQNILTLIEVNVKFEKKVNILWLHMEEEVLDENDINKVSNTVIFLFKCKYQSSVETHVEYYKW